MVLIELKHSTSKSYFHTSLTAKSNINPQLANFPVNKGIIHYFYEIFVNKMQNTVCTNKLC